jgi:hypothetical protein
VTEKRLEFADLKVHSISSQECRAFPRLLLTVLQLHKEMDSLPALEAHGL